MFFNKKIPSSIKSIYTFDSASYFYYGIFDAIIMSFTPFIMRKLGANEFTMWLITIGPVTGTLLVSFWLNLAFKFEKVRFVVFMKIAGLLILLSSFLFSSPMVFVVCFVYC